jgi:hypothetical protein
MNRVIIKFQHPTATWSSTQEVDAAIEQSLIADHGEEFLFDFDVWWKETCIEHSVYEYPEPLAGWDEQSKIIGIAWESKHDLNNFVNYFFNHEYINKFFLTLKNNGWTIGNPMQEVS